MITLKRTSQIYIIESIEDRGYKDVEETIQIPDSDIVRLNRLKENGWEVVQ